MINKRILIISNNGLSNNESNGRVLSLLFNRFNNNRLYNYCLGGKLDIKDVHYVKMNDTRNIKSLISFGRVKPDTNICLESSDNNVRKKVKRKKAIHYFIRNILYSINFHITRFLLSYIKNNIDVIFLFGSDAPYMYRLSRKLSIKCHVPLIIYTCEDYPIKNYNYIERGHHNHNIFFVLLMSSLKKQTRLAYKISSKAFFNSVSLMEDYKKIYSINNAYVKYLPSILRRQDYHHRPVKNIVYGGNLYIDRVHSLIDISKTLEAIDNKIIINVYGNASNEVIELFKNCVNIKYHGYVDYATMIALYKKADMLLHVEGFSKYHVRDCKHAFSTKIADCYKIGVPLFMYSPIEIASTKFALSFNKDYVATSLEELKNKIRSAVKENKWVGFSSQDAEKYFSPFTFDAF